MRRPEPQPTKHHYKGYDILGTHYTIPPSITNRRTYYIQGSEGAIIIPTEPTDTLREAKEYVDDHLIN